MTGDYRIELTDFGPIGEASIDVRPLTVLVGPSNAGKSYFATLIYALHRSLSDDMRVFPTDSDAQATLVEPIRKSLKGWYAEAARSERLPDMPRDLAAHIRGLLESPTELCASFTQELRRCFGTVDIGVLTRRGSVDAIAGVRLIVNSCGSMPQTRYVFRFEGGKTLCDSAHIGEFEKFPRDLESYLQGVISFIESFHAANEDMVRETGRAMESDSHDSSHFGSDTGRLSDTLGSITNTLFKRCLNPLRRNAYYLPADRTGVMHSHPVVTSALAHSFTTAGARRSPGPVLSGVMADFFTDLARMSGAGAGNHEALPANLAERLEQKLLRGRIRVDDGQVGNPTLSYRPDGWSDDLPLIRASSMVTELAPIVLYLRHNVEAGDVLIIEEPEAHLHPAMQALFARELARIVSSGVRVVMTTHSEWILEQIGNLVRVAELPEERRQGIGDPNTVLEPESVGAWLFKPQSGHKGFRVEEIVLDPETGLYPTGYDAVSEALYNEGAAIFNRLPSARE